MKLFEISHDEASSRLWPLGLTWDTRFTLERGKSNYSNQAVSMFYLGYLDYSNPAVYVFQLIRTITAHFSRSQRAGALIWV